MAANRPNLLFLPIINGKGYSKAEIELLRELDVDIQALPDGSYTINGETPEQIRANFKRAMKDLANGKPKDETANEKILHLGPRK